MTNLDAYPVLGDPAALPERKTLHHRESYCLMLYASDAGKVEWLWNSRDGVTPFTIDGGLIHCQWHMDVFAPFFVPPIGMRVFVDLTLDAARRYARTKVERYWSHERAPMKTNPRYIGMDQESAIEMVAHEMMHPKGAPDIVTVGAAMREQFVRRAQALSLP